MTRKKRQTILAILLILIGAGGFFILRSYVVNEIGNSLQRRLQSLKLSGFNVDYDSISIDWRRNTIVIDHLVLQKNAYDTTCIYPEFISVAKLSAHGFRLMPLLFKSKLSFESIFLVEPHLVIRENSQLLVDSATQRVNEFTLAIDNVFLKSALIEYTDTVNCQLNTGVQSDVTVLGLNMDFHVEQPFVFAIESMSLDSTEIKLPKQFYKLNVRRTTANLVDGTFEMDSLQVVPDYGKIEFGRKRGYEIDRFEGIVRYIKLTGLSVSLRDSVVVNSSVADVQFYLKTFRDKRLPFKTTKKDLPIAQLKKLPFTLKIDSVKVTKSFVQYEEMVKDTDGVGLIYFDDISALLQGVNSKSTAGNMTMIARAALMGHGDVRVNATFPFAENKKSWLTGSVQDFSIPKINSMLTPSTNIKVESGDMHNLSFNFSFNDNRSDGAIELNYNDLKVTSFKEEDKKPGKGKNGEDPQKDNFKSFIMNTFIFRKHMDDKVPEEKRTGTVMFIRDDSKSIFNFWVKSVLSGLKSAYNLDKLDKPAVQKTKREAKKEERLTKRQARKLKKAERKKERG